MNRAHEAEAQIVVPVRRPVPIAVRRAAVVRVVVPAAAPVDAIGPTGSASTPPAQNESFLLLPVSMCRCMGARPEKQRQHIQHARSQSFLFR